MSISEVILPLILVALYFVFTFFWMSRGYPRLEERTIQRLSERMGVRITKQFRFRSQDWVIAKTDNPTRSQGCFVAIVQMFFTMGCAAGPIFFALFFIVAILLIVSGG
jgi:hypothetical protein